MFQRSQRNTTKLNDFYHQDSHYNTIIIGAGPTGLVCSHLLNLKNESHIILEKSDDVGSSWKRLPDAFQLAMPVHELEMPGLDLSHFAEEHHLTRDEMITLLENYAIYNDIPIHFNTEILSIHQSQCKTTFCLSTSKGNYTTDNIIVCTGARQTPKFPHFVSKLDPNIVIHSADYKNTDSLTDKPTLVIGSGLSALTIAYQINKKKHDVYIACGHTDWSVKQKNKHLFFTHQGEEKKYSTSWVHSFLPSHLIKEGVLNLGRMIGVTEDGHFHFKDQKGADLFVHVNLFGKLIFATGYRFDFPFLKNLPGMKANQLPLHQDGIIPHIPGLYILGIPPVDADASQTVVINQGSREAKKIIDFMEIRSMSQHAYRPQLLSKI